MFINICTVIKLPRKDETVLAVSGIVSAMAILVTWCLLELAEALIQFKGLNTSEVHVLV